MTQRTPALNRSHAPVSASPWQSAIFWRLPVRHHKPDTQWSAAVSALPDAGRVRLRTGAPERLLRAAHGDDLGVPRAHLALSLRPVHDQDMPDAI
jgi:hypothetical protein